MTDADWQQALDADLHNKTLRLVYADWLEERGEDDRAYLQRWLGKKASGLRSRFARPLRDTGTWAWPNLPMRVWRAMDKANIVESRPTRQEAEEQLLQLVPAIRSHEKLLARQRLKKARKRAVVNG